MIRQMHKRIINMKKKNPFKTPEGYFDNFAADFMARLPENEPVTVECSILTSGCLHSTEIGRASCRERV